MVSKTTEEDKNEMEEETAAPSCYSGGRGCCSLIGAACYLAFKKEEKNGRLFSGGEMLSLF